MTEEKVQDYQTQVAREALSIFAARHRVRAKLSALPGLGRTLLLGTKVLVVGCGRGKDCTYFVEAGASSVVGLDVVDDIGADFTHPRVSYHRGSAEVMDFDDDTFDFVYSVATMEHIPDIERAFSEMVRVARPGGLVYCFAAPLWNSREGHHKFGLFPDLPWIHLRMSPEEMVTYGRERGIRASPERDIKEDVEFIFSDYFNRQPAARYVKVCDALPVSMLLENRLSQDSEDLLTDQAWRELEARGHTKEEVLTVWHRLVAVK